MLNRETILRKIFNVTEQETRTRRFVNQVTTDDYAASVLLQRELPVIGHTDANTAPKKWRWTSKSQVTKVVGKYAFDLAPDKLPDGYTPDVLIGIDPGVRTLSTAAYAGYLPRRQRRRQRKRRRRRGQVHSKDTRKCNAKNRYDQRIVGISTAEYYHLAKFDTKRMWNLNLRKRWSTYASIVTNMPSFKIAELNT
ncbi:hypothetical protein JG687_00019305 [Phytophthora cactorum]|uniref:RRXRR domain-containing protein n=1 Tax=Phytophthora cactorum TaxID=29920 RepID=A0A329RSC0_9STRA|nr:hypothetical protein GQ600_13827 [Phytophthora cactorum]KAG2768274.1 hypothetical protein Pcac1_g20561 [Phytophthora cactorum]KAG2871981.1 hypothetical protein PC114_g26628 [Phytophthora cactorum]KAG2880764.1 hypothetical protein PC117_g26508 [Phytophthora cactorum]KAG2960695.1 hypothetical protein PC119_g26315 [Phytophthora cactorum]